MRFDGSIKKLCLKAIISMLIEQAHFVNIIIVIAAN